jgi:hypothetical protein
VILNVFAWALGVVALMCWLAAEMEWRRREESRRRWARSQDREWIRREQDRERTADLARERRARRTGT